MKQINESKKINTVADLYEAYKKYYDKTGKKEYPDRLLFLLLLTKKDEVKEIKDNSIEQFYLDMGILVTDFINKLDKDFNFKEADYIKLIKNKNNKIEDYEFDKILVLLPAVRFLYKAKKDFNDLSAEEVYNKFNVLLSGNKELSFGISEEEFIENVSIDNFFDIKEEDYITNITLSENSFDLLRKEGKLIEEKNDMPIKIIYKPNKNKEHDFYDIKEENNITNIALSEYNFDFLREDKKTIIVKDNNVIKINYQEEPKVNTKK